MLPTVRQALRALGRSPGFTLAALATFAIGIGANATVFGVVNAVLLRSYPFAEPERLVALWETDRPDANGPRNDRFPLAPANFRDWQAQARSFTAMAATGNAEYTLRASGEPERVTGARVTWTLPVVLGLVPQHGRAFTREDDAPGAPPVVMISDRLWRTRFGADPRVAGRSVDMNGRATTIVGVLPQDVRYPQASTEVWAPFAMSDSAWSAQRGNHNLGAVGRLRAGVGVEAARAELLGISTRIAQQHPDFQRDFRATAVPLHESMVGQVRPVLLVLMGAVCFVLLIACTNVANLTLARGAARQREVAVRTAMGARRHHLVRQQLVETGILGVAGAGLGLGLAAAACRALPALVPTSIPRLDEAGVDWRVAAFTLVLSLVAAVAAGVVPALQTARSDLNAVLKDGGRSSTGGAARARIRDGLLVAEVAFALLLLTGAGLALTSLGRLLSVAPGFAPEQVLTASVALPRARYVSDTAQAQFWAQALPRLRAVPGGTSAAISSGLPLSGSTSIGGYAIEGKAYGSPQDWPLARYYQVSDDYFRAMGIRLERGRDFTSADRLGAPPAAIISAALAREQFGAEDPIGRRLMPFGDDSIAPRFTVVGVVGDVKHQSLADETQPALYLPHAQAPSRYTTIVLRASGDPARVASDLRRAITGLDPALAVAEIRPMAGIVATSVARPRFSALLLGVFAGCAVLLALVGIYGVVAQNVAQRSSEFAIRVALGARPGDVRRAVLGGSLRRTAIGIALGLVAAAALTRLMADQLYDTSPFDPMVLGSMSVLVALVAAAASWVPAARATRVDPVTVLRTE